MPLCQQRHRLTTIHEDLSSKNSIYRMNTSLISLIKIEKEKNQVNSSLIQMFQIIDEITTETQAHRDSRRLLALCFSVPLPPWFKKTKKLLKREASTQLKISII